MRKLDRVRLPRRVFIPWQEVPLDEVSRVDMLPLGGAPPAGETVPSLAQICKVLEVPIGKTRRESRRDLSAFLKSLDAAEELGCWKDGDGVWHLSVAVGPEKARRELVGHLCIFNKVLYAVFLGERTVFLRTV